MRIFRRRSDETPKDAALSEARRATAKMRRQIAKAERYRAKKQADPVNEITTSGPDL